MVYIKDMKKPENCYECPCYNDEYGKCQIEGNWEKGYVYDATPDWCPLVPVPEDDRTRSTPVWTNYDRLIAMNPDKLAFELAVNGCPTIYPECPAKKDPEGHSNCVKCWLDWLKSPADKEEQSGYHN